MSSTLVGGAAIAVCLVTLVLAGLSLRSGATSAKIITALAALMASLATLITALHNFI